MPVDRIRVGERHRKDMGDVSALAASMRELGLLHPVVVRPDGTLIAGERRLPAAEQLGWTENPRHCRRADSRVLGSHSAEGRVVNRHERRRSASGLPAARLALERVLMGDRKFFRRNPDRRFRLRAMHESDREAMARGMGVCFPSSPP
jgi:ParB-like nuclease domain